jgi:hypothetical protein
MEITNPQETESAWLTALEQENRKGLANVNTMTQKGRPLAPEEIVAVLNYLHSVDQYFSSYMPTANALAQLNYPRLSSRLTEVQQDIHQAIETYGDMYRNAVNYRTMWGNIQRDTAIDVARTLTDATAHAQSVYDRNNRLQALINQGVPYTDALILSQQKYL